MNYYDVYKSSANVNPNRIKKLDPDKICLLEFIVYCSMLKTINYDSLEIVFNFWKDRELKMTVNKFLALNKNKFNRILEETISTVLLVSLRNIDRTFIDNIQRKYRSLKCKKLVKFYSDSNRKDLLEDKRLAELNKIVNIPDINRIIRDYEGNTDYDYQVSRMIDNNVTRYTIRNQRGRYIIGDVNKLLNPREREIVKENISDEIFNERYQLEDDKKSLLQDMNVGKLGDNYIVYFGRVRGNVYIKNKLAVISTLAIIPLSVYTPDELEEKILTDSIGLVTDLGDEWFVERINTYPEILNINNQIKIIIK